MNVAVVAQARQHVSILTLGHRIEAARACRLAVMVALGVTAIGAPTCATAAGNVVVKQIGGALRIRGDAAANMISLATGN